MRRLVLALPVVVLLGLTAVLGYGLTRNPHILPSALIGDPAPAIDLPTLGEGGRFSLDAVRGRIVLVNVWASWCVACRGEVELLSEISQRTGVPVIGIAYKDERAAARAWLKRFGDPFAVVAMDTSGRAGVDWGISGVPETFLIDASGKVRYKVVGAVDEKAMREHLLPLIDRLQSPS